MLRLPSDMRNSISMKRSFKICTVVDVATEAQSPAHDDHVVTVDVFGVNAQISLTRLDDKSSTFISAVPGTMHVSENYETT